MAKNKQSNLIASVKMLNICVINKWKIGKNILERNVSTKEDPCCKSNKSFASNRQKEFPITRFL